MPEKLSPVVAFAGQRYPWVANERRCDRVRVTVPPVDPRGVLSTSGDHRRCFRLRCRVRIVKRLPPTAALLIVLVVSASCATGASSQVGETYFELAKEESQTTQTAYPDPYGSVSVHREIGLSHLVVDPTVDPYRPQLPLALSRVGVAAPYLVRLCVSESGAVSDVRVQKGERLANGQVAAKIKTWRFEGHQLDGKAVPFCFNLNFDLVVRASRT